MATTTIRVDKSTHARLVELSRASGASIMDTVHDAAEALRRERFGQAVATEFAELRADPDAWASYLADAEATSVADGIGQ
jgi:hypothetical protein